MPSQPQAPDTDFLPDYLTDEQRDIITAGYEHSVITAVAGSGKTSTLAWRIRYLLAQGHDPDRMLVLMFNRSARVDFERKLQSVCHQSGLAIPEIRTYHAMGLRLYKRFVREGYLPGFSEKILTEQEISYQAWLLTRRLAPEDLADEIRRNKKEFVETATGFIDRVKTTLSPAEIVFEELGYSDKHKYLVDLFHSFEQWRKRQGRISYADMLYEPVMAIHQNPPLQRLVGNKMDLILVDEYQDTNEIQHLLLRYVAGDRARVTVVGDPDQTIYEFRGAKPEFILRRFIDEFESPLEQTLSYTFRYGHRVALLANHLIHHNTGRKDVLCHSHPTTPGTETSLHRSDNDGETVLNILLKQTAEQNSQSAILFRVWSQSVPIELKLLARQIPYRIDAGKGALFSREVQAITALLRIVTGQTRQLPDLDRLELARQILRFPHVGLKEPELENLAQFLASFDGDWHERLLAMDFDALAPMAARKLRKLGEVLGQLRSYKGPVAGLISVYAEHTDLYEGIRSLALTHDAAEERIDTVQGFRDYLKSLDVDAAGALDHLHTLKQQAGEKRDQGVLLSTIHRTKGLEWPVVIIPGLQEKYLPYSPRATENTQAILESERRLLYVGMTRAKHALHLITRPESTRPHLDGEQGPSRFVPEICYELSQELGSTLDQRAPENQQPLTLKVPLTPVSQRYAEREGVTLKGSQQPATDQHKPVWQHNRVQHAVFGAGEVQSEDQTSFEVKFDKGDTLNFSKKSAHLYFSLPGDPATS
ncbi:DNA helicase-2 / ATP-dependent DNA helicase PcrA [Marinobacter persicus]|uniref:DNA 3'-5' helicase n=1 Tax=Marinobacter persicus TaxID=930118 RepID=A0A1I3QHS0_9GAMM|nr:ATP-dependent helicase [Marinobacter persicus]GHD42429.1 DNA helicase [Marinobacter persicus]SFJ33673.1 DNA helicase-2 / ATP-dependent DNA helicase PcrA [Marinobacter persicus]